MNQRPAPHCEECGNTSRPCLCEIAWMTEEHATRLEEAIQRQNAARQARARVRAARASARAKLQRSVSAPLHPLPPKAPCGLCGFTSRPCQCGKYHLMYQEQERLRKEAMRRLDAARQARDSARARLQRSVSVPLTPPLQNQIAAPQAAFQQARLQRSASAVSSVSPLPEDPIAHFNLGSQDPTGDHIPIGQLDPTYFSWGHSGSASSLDLPDNMFIILASGYDDSGQRTRPSFGQRPSTSVSVPTSTGQEKSTHPSSSSEEELTPELIDSILAELGQNGSTSGVDPSASGQQRSTQVLDRQTSSGQHKSAAVVESLSESSLMRMLGDPSSSQNQQMPNPADDLVSDEEVQSTARKDADQKD